jgi:hypothetical protein
MIVTIIEKKTPDVKRKDIYFSEKKKIVEK